MRVVVVGGGIAGLTAAYRLAGSTGAPEVTLVEGSPRCGGKLAAAGLPELVVDGGAESMLARRPEAVALVTELGLADRLVHPTDARPGLLIEGRRRSVPPSAQGVPSDPAVLGDVLSPAGWERARREPELPAPPLAGDVAIGDYVSERFGPEVTDRLLEPLLGGVYAGRSRELSFAAVSAGLFERARQGGSLTAHAAEHTGSGAGGPVFAGLVGGVHGLATALTDGLVEAGAQLRTGTTVRQLRRTRDGYELVVGPTNAAETMRADAVVLACPAASAGRLLDDVVASASAFGAIPYASVAVVTLVVRGARLEGSGLLVPPGELPTIKALTHSSRKWEWVAERAEQAWGEDVEVVRLSVGRFGDASALQVDDATLLRRTFAEAQTLPGWEAAELVTGTVSRWGGGLPQYRVGHRDLVARLRREVAAVPGLAVCGAALDGVGIAACLGIGRPCGP